MTENSSNQTTTEAGMGWLRPLFACVLLALTIAIVASSVVPARAGVDRTAEMLDEQERENDALRERIEELDGLVDSAENDPLTTERLLADDLHMAADDELIIR